MGIGKYESSPASKKQIKAFTDFYRIDMSQFEPSDINEYPVCITLKS